MQNLECFSGRWYSQTNILLWCAAATMSGTSPNGSAKGVGKPGKGASGDDQKKIVVKVAGVVVATGIAWSLYKTFSRKDHPLVNTEKGIKKDASNALDHTKVSRCSYPNDVSFSLLQYTHISLL